MDNKLSEYLKSKEWADMKVELILSRGDRCEVCGKRGTQMRHLTFERLYNEEPTDLILLCRNCVEKQKEVRKKNKA